MFDMAISAGLAGGAVTALCSAGHALTRLFPPPCTGEDFILSQRSGVEEELFKGDILGVDADVRREGGREGNADLAHWAGWEGD